MPSGPNAENAKNLYDSVVPPRVGDFDAWIRGLAAADTGGRPPRVGDIGAWLKGNASLPKRRTAREALDIVGEGNMGANIPSDTPRRSRQVVYKSHLK
jgi:hypothetical protein